MKLENYTGFYNDDMDTNTNTEATESPTFNVMMILKMVIASVGIIANFTVVFAFLNHKKLRRKIPNMFIINQVKYLRSMASNLFKICLWPIESTKLVIRTFSFQILGRLW